MKNSKIALKIIATLFLSSLFFFFSTLSSHASEKAEFTKEELQQQKDNFIRLGIDDETAEKLVQKVVNGELLDAQKETEVAKHEDELTIDTDLEEKYIEFEDGSRIQLSLEEEDVEPLIVTYDYATGTVKNNSCTSGSGYRNCNVTARYNDGIWNIRFNAKVSSVQGGYDSITSISKQAVDAVLYSVTEKKFKILKSKETSSAAAKAEYTNQFTHKLGLYTVSRSLTLYAQKDKTFARLNYY
ncbi:hypothetical protein AS888_08915 [Peribacillus simplex]|uniref:DUF5626 domain-containing protein n=1 Tax=Peribacillus simplex TaxID=1478 RepID=A0A120GNA3_9BACI|nr:hypothetical protein [Peribacillus simplex]KWW13047.1 hypothetical protein AS888_08915 [Peribacillus simplex]